MLNEEGEILKDTEYNGIRMGCTKTVNGHNDLRFPDAGVQSMDDSVDPQLPTATFTVGLSRKITFKRIIRKNDKGRSGWER